MPERKTWTEVVLMPIVIALVGIGGTYFITAQQSKNSEVASATQMDSARELADADRQVKVLDIFSEKITSQDAKTRIIALGMLRVLEPEMAEKLASVVAEQEPETSPVRRAADEAVREATSRAAGAPRIFIHIRSESVRPAAKRIGAMLEDDGYIVPGVERLVNKGPQENQLRYFRNSEKEVAEHILEFLKTKNITAHLQYVRGYESSRVIGPFHYELWFAPGQPSP
jgi:hypothetical protein